MDKVDYIIDTAESRDQAIGGIKRLVDQVHGPGVANSLIDSSDSEEQAIRTLKNYARLEKQANNMESKPLIDVPGLRDISTPDNLYQVAGDTANILGKIPATLATPITETLRAPFKYIAENVGENTSQTPPIDRAAEFRQPGVSDRAGLGLLLKDVSNAAGIRQEPLADIKSQRFPKAAQFLKSLTDPSNATAMAMEGTLAAKLPIPELASVGKVSYDTALSYLKNVTKGSKAYEDLARSGELHNVVKMIQENPEYLKYNPEKVYDRLQGGTSEAGRRLYGEGDIARTNKARGDIIEGSDFDQFYTVDPTAIKQNAIEQLNDPTILNTDKKPATRMIENEIPTASMDPSIMQNIDDVNAGKISANNVNQIVSSRINELETLINSSKSMDNKKLLSLIDEKRSLQKDLAASSALPDFKSQRAYSDYVDSQNQMSLQDAVQLRKKANAMYNPKAGEMRVDQAPMTMAGKAIVNSVDNVLESALDPAASQVYSELGSDMKNKMNYSKLIQGNLRPGEGFNPSVLSHRSSIYNTLVTNPWAKGIRPMGDVLLQRTQNIPNALSQPIQRGAMTATAAANEARPDKNVVMGFRIPRTSAGVMENLPMVRRKIEMQLGPEAVKQFDSINTTDELRGALQNLSRVMPGAFDSSKYNSIDGYISDPLLKQQAIADIMRAGGNPAELADKVKSLIDEGFIGQ